MYLFVLGSRGCGVYFVSSGRVDVLASSTLTREQAVILAALEEGDYCGEVSCLFDLPVTSTVTVTPG